MGHLFLGDLQTADDVRKGDDFHPIREEGGKFVLYSRHGRVLGRHDTKADALAQLRAVESSMRG